MDALLFKERSSDPERQTFERTYNCLTKTINKHSKGRTLVFLADEMADSLGEKLIIRGINAAIDIVTTPISKPRLMFVLQPTKYAEPTIYDWILSKAQKSSLFLLLWPQSTSLDKISKFHDRFWHFRILRVASFIPTTSGSFKIFSYFPYSEEHCGSGKIVKLIEKCTSKGFKKNFPIFSGLSKLKNFHNCDVRCFGNNQYPESVVIQDTNGNWNVQGNIVYALNTFKEHYNVSLIYTSIFDDKYGWFYYNNSMQTLIQQYENNTYEFGFGSYTILNAMNNPDLDYSFASNPECISWAIPLFAGKAPSLWKSYISEFPLLVWCFIGLAVFTATKFILIARLLESKHLSVFQFVEFLITMTFSVISDAPKLKSNLVSVNLFLLQWSVWGLIVRCAYEASLGSLMTVNTPPKDMKSPKEIVEGKLRVAGGVKMYEILKRGETNEVSKELCKKFEILPPNDGREILNDLYDNRNLAILQPNRYTVQSSGIFARARGLNSLAVVMKPCLVKTYAAPLLIRKGSFMSELLYTFISRIFEAGLMKYWRMKHTFPKEKPPVVPVSLTLRKLYGAFIICMGCHKNEMLGKIEPKVAHQAEY
ncbi:hypothetical protein J6590_047938 [Homalodisca vitripennis]|nr:hypothetical protein J6590_047938 [Homalodisca vitripennis]